MRIYKTIEEIKKDIKDDCLEINDEVIFYCHIDLKANIKVQSLTVKGDLSVWNLEATDVFVAGDIINAREIKVEEITANKIKAVTINAEKIHADFIDPKTQLEARMVVFRGQRTEFFGERAKYYYRKHSLTDADENGFNIVY